MICYYPYEPTSWVHQSHRLGYYHFWLFVIDMSSIPLDVFSTSFFPSRLVNGSLILSSDLTSSRDMISTSSSCFIILYFRRTCLLFSLYIFFLALTIVAWLLQWIDTDGAGLFQIGISIKIFLSHSASVHVFSKATNSDSIVERDVTICMDDFQDTAPPPSVITYPFVDFNSSETEIQLASEYPSKTGKSKYVKL